MSTTSCPKCHDILSIDALGCACGWRIPRVYVEPPAPVARHKGMSYRARWYAERGLPYEPPPLKDVPGWMLVGGNAKMPTREK